MGVVFSLTKYSKMNEFWYEKRERKNKEKNEGIKIVKDF